MPKSAKSKNNKNSNNNNNNSNKSIFSNYVALPDNNPLIKSQMNNETNEMINNVINNIIKETNEIKEINETKETKEKKEEISQIVEEKEEVIEKTKCYGCGKDFKHTELKHCKNCNFANYCSTDCQKLDWAIHKGFCKLSRNNKILQQPPSSPIITTSFTPLSLTSLTPTSSPINTYNSVHTYIYTKPFVIWELSNVNVLNLLNILCIDDKCPVYYLKNNSIEYQINPSLEYLIEKKSFDLTNNDTSKSSDSSINNQLSDEYLKTFPTVKTWINDLLFLYPSERELYEDYSPIWIFIFSILCKHCGFNTIIPTLLKILDIFKSENVMDKLTIENNFDFAFSDNSQGKYSIIFMLLSISIKIPVLNDIEKTKSQINIDAISYSSLMFITKYIKILYFNNFVF